jgi:hypothetical protein
VAINPYSFKDQYKPEWQQTQQQLAGTYTGGTRFDPKPAQGSQGWDPPTFDFSTPGPSGPRVSRGPGVLNSIGEGLGDLTEWMVEHVWPLRVANSFAEWCKGMGWKARLPLAVLGAVTSAGLFLSPDAATQTSPQVLIADLAGEYALVVTVGLGALAGWAVPTIIALLVVLATYLVGLSMALVVVACGLALAYSVVAWAVGWPSLASFVA